jgi:hypothetical protein
VSKDKNSPPTPNKNADTSKNTTSPEKGKPE